MVIDWQEIGRLHVVAKLDAILHGWFGVELLWFDGCQIKSGHDKKDYEFKNKFLELQIKEMRHGFEFLFQDVEKAVDALRDSSGSSIIYKTFFSHLKGAASKIVIGGEYLGTILAYPFVMDTMTKRESGECLAHLCECGIDKGDAQVVLSSLQSVSKQDAERIRELVGLVADEVAVFYGEIEKRERRIDELNDELGSRLKYGGIVGRSKPMQKVYSFLKTMSASDCPILIRGEGGTGKELVAKALHYGSARKEGAFRAIDCSALDDGMLDIELFGCEGGAHGPGRCGLVGAAEGGTLLLDKVEGASLAVQVKILRLICEKTFTPVGSAAPRKANVRVVAASAENLEELVEAQKLREDFFYRFHTAEIALVPLRSRRGDIPFLMDYFLKRCCDESGTPLKHYSKGCMEKMLDYPWPGNAGELEKEVERLFALSGKAKTITYEHLSPRILLGGGGAEPVTKDGMTMKSAVEDVELRMISSGLVRCNFNKSKLARELDISRGALMQKIEKYNLGKKKAFNIA